VSTQTGACRSWLRATAALVGAALLIGATVATQASASSSPARDADAAGPGNFAGLVELPSGRRLYLECRAKGSPTVVLEAGFGNAGDIWSVVNPGVKATPVLPAIARFTRVCAYDRPGTNLQNSAGPSRSDPVPLPRTGAEIVADLHALLAAAHVAGPYVVVGHSLGGMLMRLYAGTYPDQVVGFVSVDAAHEIYYDGYQALLPREVYSGPGVEVSVPAIDIEMRQARFLHPLRPMPMFVLEHSRDRRRFPNPFGLPPELVSDALERAFQASQDDLTTLVPHARHIIARRSEHYIQSSQPRLVVRAVRRIIDAL
jgi:pimeloyl-ACP methyl ester carboxylesterase